MMSLYSTSSTGSGFARSSEVDVESDSVDVLVDSAGAVDDPVVGTPGGRAVVGETCGDAGELVLEHAGSDNAMMVVSKRAARVVH